jgi:hypothetical protein
MSNDQRWLNSEAIAALVVACAAIVAKDSAGNLNNQPLNVFDVA